MRISNGFTATAPRRRTRANCCCETTSISRGLYGRSILLHELVHALQAQQGAAEYGSALWYRREREAYQVQYRFLRAGRFAERKDRQLPAGED